MTQNRGDRVAAGKKISESHKNSQKIKDAGIRNAQRAADSLTEYIKINKPHFTQIGKYVSAKTNIEFYCSIHNINFLEIPNYLKSGSYGCPECATDGRKRNNAANRSDVIEKRQAYRNSLTSEQRKELINKTAQARILHTIKHLDDTKREQYFNKEWMYDFHVNKQNNLLEMGEYFGLLYGVVSDQLERLGIECITQKVSYTEKELALFVESLGIDIERNNRKLLGRKELDIYIPSHKLGIEYHGCYWHSDKYHDKNYHIEKLEACNFAGIRLIQIWEDTWEERPDVCKKFLVDEIGLSEVDFDINECDIKSISTDVYTDFIDKNYIHGAESESTIHYGLFNRENLLSVMGLKTISEQHYEICRFSSVGKSFGFSKVLKFFISKYQPSIIKTFIDLEILNRKDNVYIKNGFVECEITEPESTYFVGKRREKETVNPNSRKCWNSGKICYIKHIK